MIYSAIEVYNYIGVYKGLKQELLKLEFEEDGFNVFTGKNGSGKTTIMRLLTPWAEDKTELRDNGVNERGNIVYHPAYKKLWVKDKGGQTYLIHHIFTTSGTKRCFIGKVQDVWSDEVEEEYNTSGGVGTFNTAIFELFGMEPNKIDGIITTTDSNSFLDMDSTSRKKSIASLIPDVGQYLDAYKNIREGIRSTNSQIQYIVEDAKTFGSSRESLEEMLATKESNMNLMQEMLDKALAEHQANNDSMKMLEGELRGFIIQGTNNISETREQITRNIADISANIQKVRDMAPSMEGVTLADVKLEITNLQDERERIIQGLSDYTSQIQHISDEIVLANSKSSAHASIKRMMESIDEETARIAESRKTLVVCPEDQAFYNETTELQPSMENEISELRTMHRTINQYETQTRDLFDSIYSNGIGTKGNSVSGVDPNTINLISMEVLALNTEISNIQTTRSNNSSVIRSFRDLLNSAPRFKEMGCNIDNCVVEFIEQIDAKEAEEDGLVAAYNVAKTRLDKLTEVVKLEEDVKRYAKYIQEGMTLGDLNNFITVRGTELKSILDRYNGILSEYSRIETSTKYVDEMVRNLEATRAQLESIKEQYTANFGEWVEVDDFEVEIQQLVDRRKELEDKIASDRLATNRIQNQIYKIETEKLGFLDELANIENMETTVAQLQGKLTTMDNLRAQYNQLNELDKTLSSEYQTRSNMMKTSEEEVQRAKMSLEMFDVNTNKLQLLNETLNVQELISRALHPARGIPNIISNEKLFVIERDCNEILRDYFNGQFTIKFQNDESSLEIICGSHFSGVPSFYHEMSAGERSIIKLVLSFVLMQHRVGTGLDGIMLDEIDSFLDEDNRGSFELLLDTFKVDKGISQIFIISHNIKVKGSSYFFDKDNREVLTVDN